MNHIPNGTRILIAESDRAVLEMLQIRLDVAGFHTFAARTGQTAVELMRSARPQALVIDKAFSDMTGRDLIEVARDVFGPNLPIILMGRGLSPDDIRAAVALGVRDCVIKPFGGSEILERIARLLKKPTPPGQSAPKAVVWV